MNRTIETGVILALILCACTSSKSATSTSSSPSNVTTTETSSEKSLLQTDREEKNGFDADTNQNVSFYGSIVPIPLYWGDKADNSKDDNYYYYAERTDGAFAMISLGIDDSTFSTGKDFSENVDQVIEGVIDSLGKEFKSFKKYETKKSEINGMQSAKFDFTGIANDTMSEGTFCLLFNEVAKNMVSIAFVQNEKTKYDYKSDFLKTVNNISIDSNTPLNSSTPSPSTTIDSTAKVSATPLPTVDNSIHISSSASDYKHKNYKDVINDLKQQGFTNIQTAVLYDIIFGFTQEGETESVNIGGTTDFEKGTAFENNVSVVVTYHEKYDEDPTWIKMPASSESYVGRNYEDVKKEFENIGVSDIVCNGTETYKDSRVDNSVIAVYANGQSFEAGRAYDPNVTITIEYYQKGTYDLDKNLVVALYEQDKKYATMYSVVFAEYDSNGNPINFYTFSDIINPHVMGDEFDIFGDLPPWFYVGATVRVRANLYSDGTMQNSHCQVTQVQ